MAHLRRLSVKAPLLAAILLGITLVPAENDASASFGSPTCTVNTFTNHMAGYIGYAIMPTSWNQTPEGVQATITTRDQFLCSSATTERFSTAWVMLQDGGGFDNFQNEPAQGPHHTAPGGGGLYQAGFIRDQFPNQASACTSNFWEWYRDASYGAGRHLTGACRSNGQTSIYQVRMTYLPNGSVFLQAVIDGTAVSGSSTDFNPWSYWSFYPHFSGETNNLASNMPGTSTSRTDIYNMRIQSADTHAFRDVPCYLARYGPPSGSRYWTAGVSCTYIQVWTDPT